MLTDVEKEELVCPICRLQIFNHNDKNCSTKLIILHHTLMLKLSMAEKEAYNNKQKYLSVTEELSFVGFKETELG